MSLIKMTIRQPMAVMLLCSVALTGCDEFDGIKSLTDLGRKVDPIPSENSSGTKAAARPKPDSRGVITYANYQVIIARRGDTMGAIASRVGMTATDLAKHNGLSVNHTPRQGEVLALPDSVGRIAASGTSIEDIASSAIDEAPNTPARVPAASGDNEPVRHVVEPGETAYSIARLYDVSVTALASWNGLDRNLSVREGQQLLIPVAEAAGTTAAAAATTTAASASASTTSTATKTVAAVTPKAKPSAISKPGTGSETPEPPSASKPLPKTVAKTKVPESPNLQTEKTAAASKAKLLKPVNGKVLRGFSSKPGGNEGIDFGAPEGTAVKAAANGTVALISKSVSDTTIILVRHPDNLYTVYSNVSGASVNKGDRVTRGQSIGKVAGGKEPFVHFEIRRGTEAVDPAPYL